MSNMPSDLRYTKTHEWVRLEDDGTVTVGITEHAQELLGDLVYVELPEVGSNAVAEEACAVVESVKAASDIYAPLSGEVLEANENLNDSPELVNSDAFGDGWIFKLRPEQATDIEQLLDSDAYAAHVATEEH